MSNIIIDVGTSSIKAGFSSDELPRVVFPSVIGRIKNTCCGMIRDAYMGKEAYEYFGILNFSYPVIKGDYDDFYEVLTLLNEIIDKELKVNPENYNIIMIQNSGEEYNQEKLLTAIFEDFNCKCVSILKQPPLPLFSIGKQTGAVIESGGGVTKCSSVIDGNMMNEIRVDISGGDITSYLIKLLEEKNVVFNGYKRISEIKKIKEKFCYVFNDKEKEISYMLPDGKSLLLKDILYKATEALFKPELCGNKEGGIAQKCFESINKIESNQRKELYENKSRVFIIQS